VDDGSADDTVAIVERMAAADPRLRLLRLPQNRGVSEARNLALGEARGDWLAFLDADDRLRPGGLAAMLAAADAGDARAVIGQRISTDGERTWYPRLYDLPDIRQAGRKSLAANPDLLYYAGPAGKLFHRSCAEGLRFEGRMLGDQPWVLRALVRAGDRIIVVERVVYEWHRPHPDRYVPTITSARERSAALGIEAVRMAAVAFEAMAAEFSRAYDPATRARLEARYLERLLRADLETQLRGAVRRRDAALPDLLDALAGFVAHVPTAAAAGSDAVARVALAVPADRWPLLGTSGRAAYRRLLAAALASDAGVLARLRGRTLAPLLRGLGSGSAPTRSIASMLLMVRGLAAAGTIWLRRAIGRAGRPAA
jgi:hypothetical protein